MNTIMRPVPHEGVIGTDRAGDPVLDSPEAAALVGRLTTRLYSAALGGSQNQRDLFTQMSHPTDGDLVVVMDGMYRRDPDIWNKAVGYLIGRREEWWTTDEEWEAEKADDAFLAEQDRAVEPAAWYIQYGPDARDICRWTNCTVISAEPEGR